MGRLDKERQDLLESIRINFAKKQIENLGYTISYESNTELRFEFNGNMVSLFPYSGWHSGKGIKSGRGISNLLDQIKNK